MTGETTSLPRGPRLPASLQTAAMILAPERYLLRCRRRYGDFFRLRLVGAGAFVIVADPAIVKEVFTGPADVFLAGEANRPLEALLGAHSVLLLDGPEHLRQRKLLLPPFHGARMRRYERIVERATEREIVSWPLDRAFALLPSMQQITLEVILRAVFGIDEAGRFDELSARLRAALEPSGNRLRFVIGALTGGRTGAGEAERRLRARVGAVDELLFAEIADRRRDPGLARRDDVLSMLLLARDEDSEAMTDREVRDELMTLLLAGHETTATGLAWAFERLLRHPGVLRVLTDEIAAGSSEYLDAVAREALRLRPVVPNVGRVLAEPWPVGGHRLPAGTIVAPSIWLTHRRADVYPAPRSFRPDRFLSHPPDTYAWLPFGGGSRRCLGASFALMEMRTVIRTVLERAHLEPVGRSEKVTRRAITLVPARGARVIQRRRPGAGARRDASEHARSRRRRGRSWVPAG